MDAAQLPSPQIGRILIAAGLLTEVQLAEALEEQHQTGRRLGEIIVRRGFISGPALANALAEQHGGLLKTEYGFATGLGGDVAQKAAAEAVSDTPMPMLRTADPAPVTPLRPPAPEPEPEPEPVVEEPVQPQFAVAPSPGPEPEVPQFAFTAPEPEPEPEPAAFEPEPMARVPDERDALIDSLRARVDAQDAELARLRAELEEARAAREVQVHVHPQEEPAPAVAASGGQQERYLVCVPTPAGYVLLDRIGVVPAVGHPVDVPEEDGSFAVTKVVRLPRNGRPCAYLQRL